MKQPNSRAEAATLESRAAARAMLNAPRAPHLIIAFPFGHGDSNFATATIGDRAFTRGADESAEAFENRLLDSCPVVGRPKLIILARETVRH